MKEDAASVKPKADKLNAATAANLDESIAEGEKASASALAFINSSDMRTITPEASKNEAEAKPLEVKPGPNDTVITCDGGMYFDSDEGVLVYLKNVNIPFASRSQATSEGSRICRPEKARHGICGVLRQQDQTCFSTRG